MIGFFCFFFFKQKTAYEMRISDWSSDVCSSDLSFPGLREYLQRAEFSMNKTYRTVWCEATGTFVAVGENVRARGKRTSGARTLARAALAVAVAGAMGAAQADVTIPASTDPASWDGNEKIGRAHV